jgi:hypothetical protein
MWYYYQYTVALHNFWANHEQFLKHFYLQAAFMTEINKRSGLYLLPILVI